MKNDFSSPQRQSLLGIIVMGADTMQSSIRAFFPLFLLWFLDKDKPKYLILVVLAALLVFSIVMGYLRYRNFTFYLDTENDEFVLRKGIFNKTRIDIPVDKIQNVNISQTLIQRIIRVHGLEIDTAGSKDVEVKIRAISHAQALSLKEILLTEAKNAVSEDGTTNETAAQKAHPFIEISLLSLIKSGITTNYIRSFGLLLAFAISMLQHVDDYFRITDYDGNPYNDLVDADLFVKYLYLLLFFIMVVVIIINLCRTIIRYFNFRITKQNNSLLMAYGLLSTRNTIIRPEKVQMVSTSQNYFQKKLDVSDLRIRQATDSEVANDKNKLALEIPGCNEEEREVLLRFLLNKTPERGEELKPNYRRMVFGFFKAIIIPGLLYLGVIKIWDGALDYIYVAGLYVVLVTLLIVFGYRKYRLYINDAFIIKHSGAWDVEHEYVSPHKIHTIKTTQFFWQKSADVASVKIYTAGGELTYGVANYTRLKKYINKWLYQIESGKEHWM